ncbi:hypothetical protein M1N59_01680 [Dehalococcoidales bacterium]|nr:hypothetical protein [Dehalococcoidales bacterium]
MDLIKRLIASIKCGVCGQHYEVGNIDVLGHHEDLWFLRVFCSACRAQCLVAAVIKKESRLPEVITDLTEAELDKFKNAGMLSADEVLDMHHFLKDFDGDFSRLFSQKQA